MAYSDEQLKKIQRGIASVDEEVQFGDRRSRKRSVDDLLKAEAHIQRNLQTGTRPKQSRLYTDKGF